MGETVWKKGDDCFVEVDKFLPSVVTRVGRRWLEVKTKAGYKYSFDLSKNWLPVRGPIYGCSPHLKTIEEAQREMQQRNTLKAVLLLENAVKLESMGREKLLAIELAVRSLLEPTADPG